MKKLITIIFSLLLLVGGVLFIKGKDMKEVKTEVFINRPVDEVWGVISNINAWKEWNPTVLIAEGNSSIGSKLNITINGNGKRNANYQPIVIESDAPKFFRWRAKMKAEFLFKNDRVFKLEKRDGGTFLVHSEEFSGLMVPLMWGMLEDFTRESLETMNKSLINKLDSKN